ncbi:hypothetical protein V1264_009775 [Littorina saxatilis]
MAFVGGYPHPQRFHGYPPGVSKGAVEIPVHHESGGGSGRPQHQPQPPHQVHHHQPEPQKMAEQPVSSSQHAAPPFHLHSQKDAFLPQQAGEQGHPWPMHHNHPPQQQDQEESGVREIPIQHVSTYHIPPSAKQQHHQHAQPQRPQSKASSSNVHTIPVRQEKSSQPAPASPQARTAQHHTPPPATASPKSPKKQYSAPPQPSASVRQERSPCPTPPPQEAKEQKPQTAEERAFQIIDGVMTDVQGLEEKVNSFGGIKGDKEYKFLEEMLTRSLLKLDSVETGGQENIRQARKKAVRMIEPALDLLELKAHANAQHAPTEAMDTSQPAATETNSNSSGQGQAGDRAGQKGQGHVKEMVMDSEVSC